MACLLLELQEQNIFEKYIAVAPQKAFNSAGPIDPVILGLYAGKYYFIAKWD